MVVGLCSDQVEMLEGVEAVSVFHGLRRLGVLGSDKRSNLWFFDNESNTCIGVSTGGGKNGGKGTLLYHFDSL